MVDAIGLGKRNERRAEELNRREERLAQDVAVETAAQERARRRAYDKALVPFGEVFSHLRNFGPDDLQAVAEPPETDPGDAEARRVQRDAVRAVLTMACGVAASVGAKAGTVAAVGAFATASTGTAISGLSGAAATSAVLAWLGGGSLAAGGGGIAAGTLVLGGIAAAPVLLAAGGFISWKGRKDLRGQRAAAVLLKEKAAEIRVREERAGAWCKHSRQVRQLLDGLRKEMRRRLRAVGGLVDGEGDYSVYTPAQRAEVDVLVALAGDVVALVRTPISDGDGQVSDLSQRVVRDIRRRLGDIGRAR
ncbi:hypothetical protein [Streptomyces sp. LMG1-1-1.1]|uniref:hypothetical protein n=1 Tax=Streptomyces sp. LMG1-1-1.1 TaxID=3135245 RepID=UPI003466B5C5